MAREKLITVSITAVVFCCWMGVYSHYEGVPSVSDTEVMVVCWVGILVCAVFICVWKKISGRYFTLFNIFLAFVALFNFGQCFLWALGIHSSSEIGKELIFSRVSCDNSLIILAQLQFIISYVMLNCGAICVYKGSSESRQVDKKSKMSVSSGDAYKSLFRTTLLLSVVSIPAALYKVVRNLGVRQQYGYSMLYNGDMAQDLSDPVLSILCSMFVPCLLGLLIGSQYKNKVRVVVYAIFASYSALSLLCGDRGEWINALLVLIWADFFFRKKKVRHVVPWCIVGIIALCVVDAMVSIRNSGMSPEAFAEALFSEENALVSMLTEFGASMGICIIVLKYGLVGWYGNTYLLSIPTIFSTSLGNSLFGLDYVQLHYWFPKEFLQISYGTDFSIIGEAILNFGPYVAPLIILIEGLIIGWISFLPEAENASPLKQCLSIGCMVVVLKIARSTVWYVLNGLVYPILIMITVYKVVSLLNNKSSEVDCV